MSSASRPFLSLQFVRKSLNRPNVPLLRTLGSATEKNNHLAATPLEVDPISGAVVDAQFAYALSHGRRIPLVSIGKAIQTRCDQRPRMLILEPRSPPAKVIGLPQLDHGQL
jgi:hypothetical protein